MSSPLYSKLHCCDVFLKAKNNLERKGNLFSYLYDFFIFIYWLLLKVLNLVKFIETEHSLKN